MKNTPIKIIKQKSSRLLFFNDASFSPQSKGDGFYILTVMLKKKKLNGICFDLMICDGHSYGYKIRVIRDAIRELNDYVGIK